MRHGYYQHPTIRGDTIVYVSEGDLWRVPRQGGVPVRLTAGRAEASHPRLSPDCKTIAYVGREEGSPEVFVMPTAGGPSRRLTHLGAMSRVVNWTLDGARIIFCSDWQQPFARDAALFTVAMVGGAVDRLPVGSGGGLHYTTQGRAVLNRTNRDPARWKRYRGGTQGDLWVDRQGKGRFDRLTDLQGNPHSAMWLGKRIYFLADHEGTGNLYSLTPAGKDLQRHTDSWDYYLRNADSDGKHIVMQRAGALWTYDIQEAELKIVDIRPNLPFTHHQRRFVPARKTLEEVDIHPDGRSLVLTVRGRPYTLGLWEGAALQHGERNGVRYRLATWLHDGEHFVCISDEGGEESIEVRSIEGKAVKRLRDLDCGCIKQILASPTEDKVAALNHRHELLLIDLTEGSVEVIASSRHGQLTGFDWSPDGKWLTFGLPETPSQTRIHLREIAKDENHPLGEAVMVDFIPRFSPDGKRLFFAGARTFDPVYDNLHFELGFPGGEKPYMVTLADDEPSLLDPQPRPFEAKSSKSKDDDEEAEKTKDPKKSKKAKEAASKEEEVITRIDLVGIGDRIEALPVPDGRITDLAVIDGALLYTLHKPGGAASSHREGVTRLFKFDFETLEKDVLISDLDGFLVSRDAKALAYWFHGRLRLIPAGSKPEEGEERSSPSRKSGWIDLDRCKVSVLPYLEWRQMYRETWRLMRDHFWTQDMSGVDWTKVHDRYLPILERVTSRADLSDLIWEMQGELGTSHAYEMGGDYPGQPFYGVGHLGADLAFDSKTGGWRVMRIPRADSWERGTGSPLLAPGLGIKAGTIITAIGGVELSQDLSPGQALVGHAGDRVVLTVKDDRRRKPRSVTILTLTSERGLRYRDWVEANRQHVHERSKGRIGYVHIPDMGPSGYAEFHRYFLTENHLDALLVDVRYNGGGHVSQLLLEKLARRRIGYDITRWGEPTPYPAYSVAGPMAALTNELAGSDGDIFSHAFKMMKLGKLFGTRTWGGVIGIWPRHPLVDGTIVTQPEFSYYFLDVGWGVENYGTDPDEVVENTPQDVASGKDVQLDTVIDHLLAELKRDPPVIPDFSDKPKLGLPTGPGTVAIAKAKQTSRKAKKPAAKAKQTSRKAKKPAAKAKQTSRKAKKPASKAKQASR